MRTFRRRKWRWQATIPLMVIVMATCTATSLKSAPILQYLFNETGTDAVGSGPASVALPMMQWDGITWVSADNHGPDGTGVSGLSGDRPYHDPSIVLDPGQTAGTANSHYFGGFAGGLSIPDVQALSAMTVQGWFKAPTGSPIGTDGSFGALIGNLGNSSNDGGWVVRSQQTASAGTLQFRYGELQPTLDHVSVSSNAGAYSETDEWIFFAVTLDAVTGDVQFFKGSTALAVAAAGGSNPGPLNGGALTTSNRNFYIGNSNAEGAQWSQGRAINADLDNMRVFGSVLTVDELEWLRIRDITNIPEPSTALILMGALASLAGLRQRSR